MRPRTALTVIVLGAALALSACGAGQASGPLIVSFGSEPSSLDPHRHNDSNAWSILSNFYDGLVRFSPEMRVEPALATSWQHLDDGAVLFRLRPGVRFSDGRPLTAADVVASFARARSDSSLIRHHLLGIRQVEARGDDAVLVSTDGPAPTLLNRLAFLFIVPASESRAEITAPVGTGPYRWRGRDADGAVDAESWPSWRGLPAIRRVRFTFEGDDQARTQAFMAGRADIAERVSDGMLRDIARLPGLRLVQQQRLAVQMLVVNPEAARPDARAALADPRVRRAMLLAINRDALVNRVFLGNATIASQPVHPAVFGYDPAIPVVPFDPSEARRLLAEAGFAAGFAVELVHAGVSGGLIELLVTDLARVGIRVAPVPLTFAQLVERARGRRASLLYYARSCTTGDASEFLDSSIHSEDQVRGFGAENFARYANPAVDHLLEQAARELGPARRLALLQEVERRVVEDLPVLPLTVRWGYLGVSGRVEVESRVDELRWVADYRWRR